MDAHEAVAIREVTGDNVEIVVSGHLDAHVETRIAASERIAEEVRKKAGKVRTSPSARGFRGQWWLVLDDEVVRFHSELNDDEWRSIREFVGAAKGDPVIWSKVVLVSGRSEAWTTVWERPGDRELR